MTERPFPAGADPTPWTCPFCPLLCDAFQVQAVAGSTDATPRLGLAGSDCGKALLALARFDHNLSDPHALVNGQACSLDVAIAAAAQVLAASRQPLFAGMGCDVAGARALYRLAAITGAICDSSHGAELMHGLRALQDRGAFTTTLAEVRTRADLIVCVGGVPSEQLPEFFRRCGVFESLVPERHIVVVGSDVNDEGDAALAALDGLEGISVERIRIPVDQGDLFTIAAELAARVAGRRVTAALPALEALAKRLLAARYGVIVWEAARLPEHGALVIETLNQVIGTLNRSTRAAALPLGGGDGAASVNQVFAWLSGLPMRSRAGPLGLEHEPVCFDSARLLADASVDALLWVSSFGADAPPPGALPTSATRPLPTVVLGHPALAATADASAVFIAVSTPGIGSAGHLFRTDGAVLMPLRAVRDDGLPTLADVVDRIAAALRARAMAA